jgi:hypothetical protein
MEPPGSATAVRSGPLHHGDGDRACGSGRTNGAQHARIAKRGGIALLLQIKAMLIDAAGCIDRENELQVDGGLCRRVRCSSEES